MQQHHSLADLKVFGINLLTGEADAYGVRTLCDLSEQGALLVSAYFGLSLINKPFPESWNASVGDAPAVASVLLSREALNGLKVFALLHVGNFDYVLESPGGSYAGFDEGDRYGKAYLEQSQAGTLPEGYRLHRNLRKCSRHPNVNGRNVHHISGRTE